MNGSFTASPNCSADFHFRCSLSGALTTNYTAWQAQGKAAYDLRSGPLTITPSAVLFGGTSLASQGLTQIVQQFAAFNQLVSTTNYIANTSLRWNDVGIRIGLDTSVAVNSTLTIGTGGWVGVAGRATLLSGADAALSSFGANSSGGSTVSSSDNTTALLANAEAGFVQRLTEALMLHGFIGLSYDSKVPGIRSASLGTFATPLPVPSGIFYDHEISYYAGAGLLWRFGSPMYVRY